MIFLLSSGKWIGLIKKLADLYGNWQAEYRNDVTSEECEEIKRFFQTILGKV